MTKQKKLILGFFVVLMVSMCTATDTVQAKKRNRMNRWEREHANATPWNGMYHHQSHNTPLAIIVPPTAATSRSLGWGVSKNVVTPLYHQYQLNTPQSLRTFPGPYKSTPMFPSNSDELGAYYIRGPW